MLIKQFQQKSAELALDDLSQQRSWAQYRNNVFANVERFSAHGIKPGDHVALLMHNRVEYIELLTACFIAGVCLIPINWHLSDREIHYILDDSDARLLVTEDDFASFAESVDIGLINIDRDSLVPATTLTLDTLDLDARPGVVMMYTSGTTGNPKGVKRAGLETLKQFFGAQALSGLAIGFDGKGPHLVTGPLYHAAPMMYALFDMANGAPLILMPRFDAAQVLDLLVQREVRHSHWVPTMFSRVLPYRQHYPQGFPALDFVLHGAAPVAEALKRQMIDWWGPKLDEYWGGTESGIVTLAKAEQWLQRPGTVGKPIGPYKVYAVDEAGRRLASGEQGLLCIEHQQLARPFSYYQAEQKTEQTFIGDGRFTIGDIGKVDEQGYVYLLDRESNMIISGGVNIYPAEIEKVLASHTAVADVAVFGIPHPDWGEEVKAVVELQPDCAASDALAQQLLACCREALASYKVPRSLDFMEALPRFESGKLYIRRLKEPYWQGRQKMI